MAFEISRVDIWSGELEDRPGALASTLAKIMMLAEADLDFIIVRPRPDKPSRSVLYLAPIEGPEQIKAAENAGLHKSASIHAVRLVCPDHPGLAAGIAGTLAQADLNITGMSAAAKRGVAIAYLRFATNEDADAAMEVLTRILHR